MTSIQRSGVQLLQVPGPTNLPGRVLRALSRTLIDHRGPEFAQLAKGILTDLRDLVGSELPVALFPASGTGGWEAALVNTLYQAPGSSPSTRGSSLPNGRTSRRASDSR